MRYVYFPVILPSITSRLVPLVATLLQGCIPIQSCEHLSVGPDIVSRLTLGRDLQDYCPGADWLSFPPNMVGGQGT